MKDWGNYSDQELVQMSMKGDSQAFTHIVRRYEGPVARAVMGILGHGPEAEDIGQETFVRFFRSMNQFRWESALGTYLTRIAINLSLNAVRKRKRFFSLFPGKDPEMPGYDPPDPDDGPGRQENRDIIQHALQKLSPGFRAVVTLRLIEGYSTRETAEILNLPLGTVLSRLSRAQNELRTYLNISES